MHQISDLTGFLPHPVKGASSAFAILFTMSGVLHTWQSGKYKSWYYTWLLPCGCLIFAAGFICREYTSYFPTSDSTFTAAQGLFYSAVPIITVPLYLFLARLLATHLSLTPISFFLTTTVISLTAQGAASFFNPDATRGSIRAGLALLRAGLIIQLSLNVAFIAIITIFYSRYSSKGIFRQSGERRTEIVTITLFISMVWILVRNLFRTVQIFLPSDSPAWTAEGYFWVFDATLMLAYTAFLHVLHPAKYIEIQIQNSCCGGESATGQANDIEIKSESQDGTE